MALRYTVIAIIVLVVNLPLANLLNAAAMVDNIERITIANSILEVHWQSDFNHEEKQRLTQWLRHAANTATQLYGEFPLSEARIQIKRANSTGRSPVPWGQTLRRGVEGARYVVDLNHTQERLLADWTAPHEFSHLFLPYLGGVDAWLSEGFASYYQNVLMARAGILSPEQAWQKLHAGFLRAQQDTNRDKTLNEVSQNRRATRATMRVYWSGALFFLEADVALRKQSQSLDDIIRQFNACCRFAEKRWSGKELMAEFDRLSQTKIFSELYQRYANSLAIPDHANLFVDIGADINNANSTENNAATISYAIMQARQ